MAELRDDALYDALERWLNAGAQGEAPDGLDAGVAEVARRMTAAAADVVPDAGFAARLGTRLADAATQLPGQDAPHGDPSAQPGDASIGRAPGPPDPTGGWHGLSWPSALLVATVALLVAIPMAMRACAPKPDVAPAPPTSTPSATWTAQASPTVAPSPSSTASATSTASVTPIVAGKPPTLRAPVRLTAPPILAGTATRTPLSPPTSTQGRPTLPATPTRTPAPPTPTDTRVPTLVPSATTPPPTAAPTRKPTETHEPTTPPPPTIDREATSRAANTATARARQTDQRPTPSQVPTQKTPEATDPPDPTEPTRATPPTARPTNTSGTVVAQSQTSPFAADVLSGTRASDSKLADETARIWLPIGLVRFVGSFPVPPPAGTPRPGTAAPTSAPPTATPPIDATSTPLPNRGPVNYPKDPNLIVMQLGWSDTEQPGLVWEEMNGTPYFTLYGDGRVLAGQALFDWPQGLYETHVSEAEIQGWLVPLTYDLRFFFLPEAIAHPETDKYQLHIYVRYSKHERDFKRVSIGGLPRWLRPPLPEGAESEGVAALARWVKDLETWSTDHAQTAFTPARHTVLANETIARLTRPPNWTQSLNIQDISDKAPLQPSGDNPHGPPGHRVVEGLQGRDLWLRILPDAQKDWPGFNQAEEYAYRGKRYIVGARQEVPGGSLFLPPVLSEEWYREDK